MWGTFFNSDGPVPAVYPGGMGVPTLPPGATAPDVQLTGSAVNPSSNVYAASASTGDGVVQTPPAAGGNCCDDCARHSLFRCFIGWVLVLIGLYVVAHAILIRVL